MFVRPDLLWFIPFAEFDFLHEHMSSDRDVWVHDTYFADVPDTFAYISSRDAAHSYFSLQLLVHHNVACLGGPDFNQTLVKPRLVDRGVEETSAVPWCADLSAGFSEHILKRKFSAGNLTPRYIPAGAAILRPVKWLNCQPLRPRFLIGWAKHYASLTPNLICNSAALLLQESRTWVVTRETLKEIKAFRIRRGDAQNGMCLTLVGENETAVTTNFTPCQNSPPIQQQLYSLIKSSSSTSRVYSMRNQFEFVKAMDWNDMRGQDWILEDMPLYSPETLTPRPHGITTSYTIYL